MGDPARLDDALALRSVVSTNLPGWRSISVVDLECLAEAAREYRDLLANPPHDKNRTCERTEEVLDHYRERALRAERLCIRLGYKKSGDTE